MTTPDRINHSGKIFGIGFSKTGTKTLASCMRELGYNHFSYHKGLYERVHKGNIEEAMAIIERHDSFDDWPWTALYKILDDTYPNSKFILTVRNNSEAWFESLVAHVKLWGPSEEFRIVYDNANPAVDKEKAISIYENHNREVLNYFARRPDKLLVVCWENSDGWMEICSFLNKEIPNAPFPHSNKKPQPILFSLKRARRFLQVKFKQYSHGK